MREISRTGLKVVSSTPLDIGRTVSLRLIHGDDVVEGYGAVRWCRSATQGEPSASFEIGIAFTEVGNPAPDSLWRSLSVYRPS